MKWRMLSANYDGKQKFYDQRDSSTLLRSGKAWPPYCGSLRRIRKTRTIPISPPLTNSAAREAERLKRGGDDNLNRNCPHATKVNRASSAEAGRTWHVGSQ